MNYRGALLLSDFLNNEVLRVRMVHDDCRGGLLGFEEVSGGEADADVFFRLEQLEELGLVFEIRARRITERVARAAVLLVEEIADVVRVVTGDAKFLADVLVHKFGEGFGGDRDSACIRPPGRAFGFLPWRGEMAEWLKARLESVYTGNVSGFESFSLPGFSSRA